ncbi:MAG: hypothetical protein OXG44_01415 [Gammaproteobacteria bacterium]|nr:hypothetical protein [Gammaproteobacteria bacterium]
MNLRIVLLMLAAVLTAALLVAILAPGVGLALADGAQPAVGTAVGNNAAYGIAASPGPGAVYGAQLGGRPVMLAECTALPCLLEVDIGSGKTYIIVAQPGPKG